ncbi:MAG: Transcriptional regulatory protein BaeR [Anaerolineales bacterium]|nr:response regulator transcription factor [Anaerolineae bacterium]MBL8105289.1 response regulator transcription factor [Anaerolineales bacterium]MBL8110864.1 response regulator transcription factor [Anaerolineales bacterium]MBV6400543.1 Transcriptional regulatory protein BaeR [Anaerolineales bacterium]MCC6567841.1 response regulator transcription factor [Anaerolineales bacterium]
MKSNILVVDDEPVARQSMTDILRLEGLAVNSVPNGQAAIEFVRTHPVELMIVDLRMPGMDGLEVVQVVNQISPETEIVLLTAFATTESAIQALRLRIHDYLLKPASPTQVIASVKKGLARRDARLKARGGNASTDVDEGNAEFNLKDGTYIDLSRRLIRKKDHVIHLTPAEGRLLRVLIENPGRVYSHRELVLLVQGYDTSQREAPEILRPLVSRLRHKIEPFPSLSDRIVSVRGTGYLYEGDK